LRGIQQGGLEFGSYPSRAVQFTSSQTGTERENTLANFNITSLFSFGDSSISRLSSVCRFLAFLSLQINNDKYTCSPRWQYIAVQFEKLFCSEQ